MKKTAVFLIGVTVLLSACSSAGESTQTAQTVEESTASQEESAEETESAKEEETDAAPTQEAAEEPTSEAPAESGEETVNGSVITDSGPTVLHVTTSFHYRSDSDETTYEPILTMDSVTMTIQDPGYETLNDSVNRYWDGVWDDMQSSYDELYQEAKSYHEEEYHSGYYTVSRDASIQRADDRIFSFLDQEEWYSGGAHGGSYQRGVNMDAATGQILTLKDVAKDYDQVYAAVTEELARIDAGEEDVGPLLFEDYKDTVSQMFYGGGDALEWTISREGVTVYFNEYVVASYAMGCIEVPLHFSEFQDLFQEKYLPDGGGLIRLCRWGYDDAADVTGDGVADALSVSAYVPEGESESECTVSVNDVEAVPTEYGSFDSAWVLYGENGRIWCYVQLFGDNDWPIIAVFELTGGTPVYVTDLSPMILREPGGSTENFVMSTRMEFLGSYSGWKDYRLGEDGLPEANTDFYTLYGYGTDNSVTVKTEIPATVSAQPDITDGTETTLAVGTVLHPVRTDGESWMVFRMDDGGYCRVQVEGEPFYGTINGINEFDCFEGLFYVG